MPYDATIYCSASDINAHGDSAPYCDTFTRPHTPTNGNQARAVSHADASAHDSPVTNALSDGSNQLTTHNDCASVRTYPASRASLRHPRRVLGRRRGVDG
jgi:hypothetical protein